MDQYHGEVLRTDACRRYVTREEGVGSSDTAARTLIELNIGDFCDVIDETFAVEIANDSVPFVRLVIDSAEDIHPEVVALLAKYVAPKIIELSVINCRKLSWKSHLKPIMECVRGVEIINLERNKWVDDQVVDQITLKFTKCLRELNLENTKVSDHALSFIGKRCPNLRKLMLMCCPKVSDKGLSQMVRKIHLSSLHISHNLLITDVGIEKLISASSQLTSIELQNCPNITDKSIEAMYEGITAWGKRRNTKSASLKKLVLRDCHQLTYQSLIFISTAVPGLKVLDLRDCLDIDLTHGLKQLEGLKCIEELYLGPTDYPVEPLEILQSILFHAANLRVLHMIDLQGVEDDHMAEILDGTLVLEELRMEGMEVGIHTVESLCSAVPNLKQLHIVGSKFIQDADVRCVAAVCLRLEQLTLSKCSKLTDAAFTRCSQLTQLRKVNLAQCSKLLDGSFLGSFTLCPMESLTLDGLALANTTFGKELGRLSTTTTNRVLELSMQNIGQLDNGDVEVALRTFWNCTKIDITGSGRRFPASLMGPGMYKHPFLSLKSTHDFIGYSEEGAGRIRHAMFQHRMTHLKNHRLARGIQACRHQYVERMKELARLAKDNLARHRHLMAALIQGVARGVAVRGRVGRRLGAGRRIVRGARRWFKWRLHAKLRWAKGYYVSVLKRRLFTLLHKHKDWSIGQFGNRLGKLYPRMYRRVKKQTFSLMVDTEERLRDERLFAQAIVLWEGHFLRKIMWHWKQLRGETRVLQKQLRDHFMLIAQEPTHNTARQNVLRRVADNFYRQKILVISWVCINDDFIRARKAEMLVPMAQEHWDHSFFERVVRGSFTDGIVHYVMSKRVKNAALAKAPKGRKRWLRFNGMRYAFEERERRKRARKAQTGAVAYSLAYGQKMAVCDRFIVNVYHSLYHKRLDLVQYEWWCQFKTAYYWKEMLKNLVLIKALRKLEWLASVRYRETYQRRFWDGWMEHYGAEKNIMETTYHDYMLRWCKKCFNSLKMEVEAGHQYLAHLNEQFEAAEARKKAEEAKAAEEAGEGAAEEEQEEEEEEQEEEDPEMTEEEREAKREAKAREQAEKEAAEEEERVRQAEEERVRREEMKRQALVDLKRRVTTFQACVRGALTRTKWEDRKTDVYSAIQVLQNNFRRVLARLLRRRLERARTLRLFLSEERESNDMWRQDQFSQLFRTCFDHSLLIQRVYRGWRGRVHGAVLAYKISREKNQEWYKAGEDFRANLAAMRRELERLQKRRFEGAQLIQKRARGMLARIAFIKVRAQAKKVSLTIAVQRDYRKRLGQLTLLAMRRDKHAEIRFRAARAQRGMLLRAFGFRKRKQQAILGVVLDAMGVDPMSYNYRFRELVDETIEDMHRTWAIFKRELGITQKDGLRDGNARIRTRRNILFDQHIDLRVLDPCRIMDPNHPYVGCTGLVTRIDKSIPGTPLFEVKLDGHNGRQTFVHMTTDPLQTYMNVQPLAKIPTKPKLRDFHQPFLLFGQNEGDPMFTFRNIHAAWTIQRAFRMYRSRKLVARKRYEFWLRSGDMQWNFFSHLAETNTLTMQANNILYYLGVRPVKPVQYEEVRHPLISERFLSSVAAKNEKKNLKEEFAAKYRERLMYLQKSAVIEGKEYFPTGFEKITSYYKMKLAFRRSFGVRKKKEQRHNHTGHKAIKAMQGKQALVEGLDVYDFKQFVDSPHIRYYKQYLYQGQWSGIPLFTQLKPHGEGMLIFFDGWGFAREEKVVYIELIACRHLNAADLDTSDPYAKMTCNGTLLTSSVKWRNLNPVYNERFEIDVTNSSAKLNIAMFDYDYIGSDDFLGQIELRMADFADGKEKHETYQLRGEDINADEDFDRGEIELRIRWATRKFEQDLLMEELRDRKAIKIQTWARRIASVGTAQRRRAKRELLLKLVRRRSVQITNTCRILIARKKLRKLRARRNACIKIQKRARVRMARNETKYRRARWYASIKIQAIMRGFLASAIVKRVKKERKERMDYIVTIIQKSMRRKLARLRVNVLKEERKIRLEAEEAEKEDDDFEAEDEEGPSVREWVKTYGVDPEYGLRRNRRMTENYFQRIIRMPYIRLVSKYGVVYADEYPALKSDEDMLAEKAGEEPLTNREDFVGVYFPQFDVRGTHRAKAIVIFNDTPHFATLHLPTAIFMRQTVDFNVVTIQCAARMNMARNAKKQILKYHEAFRKFQRIFKRRNETQQKAAMLVTALFHLIHAKHRVNVTRKEMYGSVTIQCAFRCYRARCKIFDRRCVRALSVLKYSSAIPFHGPAKALEFRIVNFWMSDSPQLAELRVEMRKIECITEVWIMTSTLKCCPRFVSISCVTDKKAKSYVPLVERSEMRETRGPRWHKYAIGESLAKYYKITFEDNYGDDAHIGVRQIRFMRAREKSPRILEQPDHCIMKEGPVVGRIRELMLHCPAEAWPKPTYQWYRNGRLVPGATDKDLKLVVKCPLDHTARSFRCLKCKMFSRNIPNNAYRVRCRNCNAIFVFKEFKEYMKLVEQFLEEELLLKEEMKKLEENKAQMDGMADIDTNGRMEMLLQDLKDRIGVAETRIQELKEARFSAKSDLECANAFTDEGIYFCIVTNIRGGSIPVMRKSRRAVVVVEHSVPYAATVKPYYRARKQEVRKKWTTYQSIFGTFVKGHLKGIVTIRYSDGSFYEGPYIGEEWLDAAGRVIDQGRPVNHYGIFQCNDGRVFEGKMIDNHFDPNNLQSFYRLTTAQGEQYEGMFCDEAYHGTGVYKFADGSVYEGHWHRGTRFGHGHLRSSEGWTYEGGFNTNTRHGYGCINYPDGSMYMGQWYYDKKQGRGVLITELRDIYKGEIVDGIKQGFGEMLYADGSRHVGIFKNNCRNGKGIFRDSDGTEHYGTFVNDCQHGEHVMKFIIPIEEEGQENFEIRVGVFDMGEFKKWKIKYANPQVTKQFVKLFTEDRAMFDSVYSMVVAKNLPNVPEGVDRNDPEVQEILKKIRNDAGGLVGQGAKMAAQKQLDDLLGPLKATRADIERITNEIDEIALKSIAVDKEAAELMRRFGYLMGEVDKGLDRIEQYWIDEPSESRRRFKMACDQLNTIATNEYFTFRNHRIPPPFTKKIMDCVCILLDISRDWKQQQLIISNSVVTGREGDDLGLRFEFDCKLAFLMKDYDVYKYARCSEGDADLASILCDPRLRRDSYYVESCGPAGPAIVDWIKTNVLYLEKSRTVVDQTQLLGEKKAEAFRLRVLSQKKSEEFNHMTEEMDSLKKELSKKKGELMDLDEAVAKVAEMLDFITANDLKTEEVTKEDYYLEMEQKIEAKKDHFIVETCTMFLVGEVEERRDLERQVKIREALARGEVFEEDASQHPKIKDWLMDEVRSEQARIIKDGRTLGYSILPDETALSWEETQFILDMIVLRVVGKLNEAYNDFASSLMWHTQKGKSFDSRFMYILTWKYWEQEGEEAKEIKACIAWEETFAESTEQRAKMSIEAKVNHRMSEEAREQGRIWGKRHKVDVLKAEQVLSEQFEFEFMIDRAKNAFEIMNDETGSIPPQTQALAVSWARLHPEEMNEAKDEHNQELAESYAKQTGDKAGYTAVKIFNGFATEDEMAWESYAEQWKNYNNEEYLAAQAKLIDENCAAFVEEYPNFTAHEAASIIENDTLSQLVLDTEVQEELTVTPEAFTNAKCWGLRNVGILRAATAQLTAKNEARLKTLWIELETATEAWKKGSFLLLPPAAQENPDLDRFSGFRARLENKYAWVYGFLSKLHIDLFADIETFASKDPMGKVIHGIRPSTFEKYKRNIEESFLKHKKLTDSKLADTIAKISTWNSYFGVKEEEEEQEGGGQVEQEGSQVTGGST